MPFTAQEVDDLRERIEEILIEEREANKLDPLVTSLIVRLENRIAVVIDDLEPDSTPPASMG